MVIIDIMWNINLDSMVNNKSMESIIQLDSKSKSYRWHEHIEYRSMVIGVNIYRHDLS